MKAVVFILIIPVSNFTYACDNSPSAKFDAVQFETNELLQTEADGCCSELY